MKTSCITLALFLCIVPYITMRASDATDALRKKIALFKICRSVRKISRSTGIAPQRVIILIKNPEKACTPIECELTRRATHPHTPDDVLCTPRLIHTAPHSSPVKHIPSQSHAHGTRSPRKRMSIARPASCRRSIHGVSRGSARKLFYTARSTE